MTVHNTSVTRSIKMKNRHPNKVKCEKIVNFQNTKGDVNIGSFIMANHFMNTNS
jgi:hypothetical protein